MGIEFKKMTIENRMLNVVSYESFYNNKDVNNNTLTAVEKDGTVYPIRNSTDDRAGMYNAGCIDFFVEPLEEDRDIYSSKHIKDIGNASSMPELMKTLDEVSTLERQILTSPDNIYVPKESDKDSPVMKGLKQAIKYKQIDLNKYQDRFGRESFPNDKRKLKEHDITLFMLNRYTKALDIKGTLILEDRSPNVANPMGEKIVIDLMNYDSED